MEYIFERELIERVNGLWKGNVENDGYLFNGIQNPMWKATLTQSD